MAAGAKEELRRVAVIGNPNTGKTTLFNLLTGLTQRVGNYPGVTVEKKTGMLGPDIEVVDLPGTYSLAAYSPDEMVSVRVLLGELAEEAKPDLAVVVVDAANLKRNLYLVTQVMDTGIPTVVVLNMVDVATRKGVNPDPEALSAALGVPVLTTVASRGEGLDLLRRAIDDNLSTEAPRPAWRWPTAMADEVEALAQVLEVEPFFLIRGLVDTGGSVEKLLVARRGEEARVLLGGARERIRAATGSAPSEIETSMRYDWIEGAVHPLLHGSAHSRTDRIDAVLTHRLLGAIVFVLVMSVMFVSIFEWAGPFMEMIDGAFGSLGELVSGWFAGTASEGGMLESFLVNGLIAGVGGVLIFLPQIVFLFLFIAILEDCGYLSRAALLMDRLLRFCGLSGHSFIPLLSSFACAVPGLMATRTISDRRDRIATIVVAPLMSCSARLPVYTLLIAAFVPATLVAGFLPLQGLVFAGMYFLGIVVAAIVALLLKKTILSGEKTDFMMELPSYRLPTFRNIALRVYDRSREFVYRAGTMILAVSIIVWALGYFPRPESVAVKYDEERSRAEAESIGEELESRVTAIGRRESGEYLRQSLLGRMGRGIEPVVRPLGWDWKIGTGVIAAFPARELIISTLGIIYDLGDEVEGDDTGLTAKIKAAKRPDGTPAYDLAVALSLMVFFALCCQCGATVATIRKETNSWRWPLFAFSYMTVLAYVAALVTYTLFS